MAGKVTKIQRSSFLSVLKSGFTTNYIRSFCVTKTPPDDEEREKERAKLVESASIDEPPTTCCQCGCANCVYILWAEALTKKMNSGDPEVVEKVMELVENPSLRAFLEMELRLRGYSKN